MTTPCYSLLIEGQPSELFATKATFPAAKLNAVMREEKYGIHPDLLAHIFIRNGIQGAIFGSTAVAVATEGVLKSTPSDLDIAIEGGDRVIDPETGMTIKQYLANWLVGDIGYEVVETEETGVAPKKYDYTWYIQEVVTYRKGDAKIDLVYVTRLGDFFSNTDFQVCSAHITFKRGDARYGEPQDEYMVVVKMDSAVVKMDELVLYHEWDIRHGVRLSTFLADRRSAEGRRESSPLCAGNAASRLARLEKYLARGFTMAPETEAMYRAKLMAH